MATWPRFPAVYEVNTWVWLRDLRQELDRPISLGDIPEAELERLAALQFDGVWLMGVWERSPASRRIAQEDPRLRSAYRQALPDCSPEDVIGSPYAIHDYRVDPMLGGDAALATLRERLRRLNLLLILDFVPNHLAVDHRWVTEHPDRLVRGSPASLRDEPSSYFQTDVGGRSQVFANGRDPSFSGWSDTVQLDYRRPETRRAVAQMLVEVAGRCDGARCDMAMLLIHDVFLGTWGGEFDPPGAQFWPDAVHAVKEKYPGFLMLAEAYWDMEEELQRLGFDYAYDKRLYDELVHGDTKSVRAHLGARLDYQHRLARFVENHDEQRALACFSMQGSFAAAVLTLMLPGLRLFHDGQLDGRRLSLPVQLGRRHPEPTEPAVATFYARLLAVLASQVFHHGEWRLLEVREAWEGNRSHLDLVAYSWTNADEYRLVAVNMAPHQTQGYIPLDFPALAEGGWDVCDLLSDRHWSDRDGANLQNPGLYLDLAGYDYHLIQFLPRPSAAEKRLEEAVRAGHAAEYTALDNQLRAAFVRRVIEKERAPRGVRASGASITGVLDLTDMSIPALSLRECYLDVLKLDNSQVLGDSLASRIELQGCTARAVTAEAIIINGDLIFRDAVVTHGINLSRGWIGRGLVLQRVTVGNPTDLGGEQGSGGGGKGSRDKQNLAALECRHLRVKEDVDLHECGIRGGANFAGAEVGGGFTYTGLLECKNGVALSGSRMEVKGTLRVGHPYSGSRMATIVGAVQLVDAGVGVDVDFRNARIEAAGGTAFDAGHIRIGEDLYLSEFRAEGQVRLVGATVTRKVFCTGGKFCNEREVAIDADGLVAKDIYLNSDGGREEFIAEGGIRLSGARISGEVVCDGIVEAANGSPAVFADGAEICDLFLRGQYIGEVSLRGAVLARQLKGTSGKFYNMQGNALTADRLMCGALYLNEEFVAEGVVSFWGATLGFFDGRDGLFRVGRARPVIAETNGYQPYALDLAETAVKGHVLARRVKLEGGLSLASAHISGNLDLVGATISPTGSGPQGIVLNGQDLVVDGTLGWRLAKPPLGKVDLSRAKVGRLSDDLRSWPRPGRGRGAGHGSSGLTLTGFRYSSTSEEGLGSVRERLSWLASATPFSQQPYEELARCYEGYGRNSDARRVRLREQQERTRQANLPAISRAWNHFLGWTVGYGYRPQRMLIALLIVAAIGGVLFHQAQHSGYGDGRSGVMEAVSWRPSDKCDQPGNPPCHIRADDCTSYYPCFSPAAYSVQLLIPVVNFRQIDYWLPDMSAPWGTWYLVYTWATIFVGWVAATALAAGLGRVWRAR